MARRQTVANMMVQLEAQSALFERRMDESRRHLQRLERQTRRTDQRLDLLGRGLRRVGAAAAAFLTIDTARRLSGFVVELGRASDQIGITVEDLQRFAFAGQQVGLSFDQVSDRLAEFTQRLGEAQLEGTGEAIPALEALKIDIRDVDGLRAARDVLRDVFQELEKISNPALRARLTDQLFGDRGFARLAGNLRAANEELATMGNLIGQDLIDRAEQFDQRITKWGWTLSLWVKAQLEGIVADLQFLWDRFRGVPVPQYPEGPPPAFPPLVVPTPSGGASGLDDLALERTTERVRTLRSELDQLGQTSVSTFADTFAQALLRGQASFSDFARSVIADLIALTTRMLIFRSVASLIGGPFAGFAPFNVGGAAAGVATAGAGVAAASYAQRAPVSAVTVQVQNQAPVAPGGDQVLADQIGREVERAVATSWREQYASESRPGGAVNPLPRL